MTNIKYQHETYYKYTEEGILLSDWYIHLAFLELWMGGYY
jgi:hypothetical protein